MYLVRSGPPSAPLSDSDLSALADRLRGDVERWSFPRHYAWEPDANKRAAEELAERLDAMGFQVIIDGRWRNVLALPKDREQTLTLVGAHYDSVPRCPGADDNASALAAMLYAAERVGPRGDCMFIAFNREEDGLLGSKDLVEEGLDRLDLEIGLAHILEMVGYTSDTQRIPDGLPVPTPPNGRFLGLIGKDAANREIRRLAAMGRLPVLGLQTWLGVDGLLPVLHRSDHSPFWKAGIPALMWTDTAELRNPHYHQPTDTPETLDYAFLAHVSALLVDGLSAPE